MTARLTALPAWTSPLSMVAGLGIRPGGEEFRRTPALEVINRALVETLTTPDARLCLSVAPQEGKGLDLDTPIATPAGWTTMGELKAGDVIYGGDGSACYVAEAFPVRELDCYRVTFIDGSVLVADGDHKWKVWDRSGYDPEQYKLTGNGSRCWKVVDTRELARDPKRYAVPTNPALRILDRHDLLLSPYVLGAWLGDGHTAGAGFTSNDPEMADYMADEGWPLRKCSHKYGYTFGRAVNDPNKGGFVAVLRSLGVLGNKHIPVEYLRASFDQRLALLQGLMDTDGTAYYTGTQWSKCNFASTKRELAFGTYHLARSLGIRAVIFERRAKLDGRDIGPMWDINFTTDLPVFRLKRKLARLYSADGERKVRTRIGVRSVEPTESVPTRCIRVNSHDGTFLAGESLTVTHNSSSVSRAFPLWALWRNRNLRIVLVSYSDSLARSLSGQIRQDVATYAPQLGMTISDDTRAKNEWRLKEGGGVYAVGIGGGLSGRPADLMLLDDVLSGRTEAESPAYRQRMYDWWTSVGSARLSPGAPVVIVGTRYHELDMIGHVLSQEDGDRWRYVNIPAQADHKPEKGEVDILGREPGEFMVSARGRTPEQWQQRKVTAGARDWAALYQGRPSPAEGGILKREHWRFYDYPLWVEMEDGTRRIPYAEDQEVLISVDCAFKNLDQSDYVAIQVWMRRGPNAYLLDQSWGHYDFVETCSEVVRMAARWPDALLKLIEDAANGPAVIATLRTRVSGIVPDTPQGSKESRAFAMTPFMEAGNVWLPEPGMTLGDGSSFAWVGDFIEEASGFPNASHDDRVDAATAAIKRLLILPFVEDGDEIVDEETEMADMRGWSVSPY